MRKKCEALWGNITMYHLVALGLMLLTIQAFVLSGLSAIYFTPAQLLASVIVLVVVSYLANRIFAVVMRVRPHSESAVITGLILFFVTTPMTVPADLLTLAAVAAVAVASKYVITYHGRHILNPAAAGMAVIAATGLGWSAWWIGTPSAFALVVVCGAAIAYRVRMLGPAVAYLGVAVGVYTLFLVVGGAVSLPQAISFAVLSSAFPFVAGFMLTEPLTLPNSRRSRYGVAVVAGVLCGWPLSVSWPIGGSLTFGPEWAILVGNLLAWGIMRRRAIRLTVVNRQMLTDTSAEIEFETARPLQFRPGQYLELTLPHRRADLRGLRRMFSITSAPGSTRVRIGVGLPAGRRSSFKKALMAVPDGTVLTATGVYGDLVLPQDQTRPIVMIAQGIGVTPFVSQVADASTGTRPITLVWALAAQGQVGYPELRGPQVFVTSATRPADLPDSWTYLGAERITAELLGETIPDLTESYVMISGSPRFVSSVSRQLRRRGVRVHTDPFYGV